MKEILSENTDEIIGIGVVLPTIFVFAYQAITGSEITMPSEPAMIILGYYFGRRLTKE
jgi:hypothetical protein